MSSRLIQVLLALSLLLNTFVLVGFVYRSWIVPPPFERPLRERIFRLSQADASELCDLDVLLGEAFAAAARAVCAAGGARLEEVDLIGSHGQTAVHHPRSAGRLGATLQIGEAAVIADRTRGASWQAVAEALDVPAECARNRFAEREREFREALLFPHRYAENGCLGYTVAPYAVEEPDRVREQLDAWVVEHRRSSGPDRDEPQPVTRGLAARSTSWITERIGQVLELSDALIKRELPAGVSYEQAELRHARLKVELYEAMVAQRPGHLEVELQLIEAREQLSELTA